MKLNIPSICLAIAMLIAANSSYASFINMQNEQISLEKRKGQYALLVNETKKLQEKRKSLESEDVKSLEKLKKDAEKSELTRLMNELTAKKIEVDRFCINLMLTVEKSEKALQKELDYANILKMLNALNMLPNQHSELEQKRNEGFLCRLALIKQILEVIDERNVKLNQIEKKIKYLLTGPPRRKLSLKCLTSYLRHDLRLEKKMYDLLIKLYKIELQKIFSIISA